MKTLFRNLLSILRRFKMATLLNILGLSVAFTAVIIIMMQVTYDLGFDRSHPEAGNIYRVEAEFEGRQYAILPRPLIENFKESSPHVKAAAFCNAFAIDMFDWFFRVDKGGELFYFSGKVMPVSSDYIHVFEFDMVEGLASQIEEPMTALIPESLAKRMFGDQSAIHKEMMEEELKLIVGGVYKDFPNNSTTKNVIYVKFPEEQDKGNWGNLAYEGYVLLDSSANMDEVFDTYVKSIDPNVFKSIGMTGLTFSFSPLKDIHFNTNIEFDSVEKVSRQTIWVLIAIAFVILLIAAINFTNYSIALTPLRIKSVNTQKVLGARDRQLRGSLVVEAIFICILSWGISLLFTHLLSMTSLQQILNANMALSQHWGLLIGVAIVAFMIGVFAGIYPAYYVTSFAPALVLKGSFGLSPKGRQLRNSLVGVQFVTSFALIVISVFMYLQIQFMQKSSLGFDKEQIIVTNLNNEIKKSRDIFSNEIKANPNIEAISYAESLLSGFDSYSTWSRKIKDEHRMFQVLAVDTGFLRTMGIPLLEGRSINASDMKSDNGVYIFNEKARDEFQLTVGEKIEYGDEVIGFIPNVTVTSLRKELEPMAFTYANLNNIGGSQWAYIRVKAGSDLKEAVQYVESTLNKLSPGYPFNVRIYDNILNNLYAKESHLTTLITWFSLIAVLISMVGVFGLVVFESEYKRKEIGVRKVLGSTTTQILAMFNMRYVRILAICFILAAPIAWYAVARWLESFAYRTPMYWWVFLFSFLLITAITVATVTFQSWRVADANPVDSLKME